MTIREMTELEVKMFKQIEELRADNARLREAIKLEAGVHARHFPVETTGEVKCYCDICLIAREGR